MEIAVMITIFYIVPLIMVAYMEYLDERIQTIGDLFKTWWTWTIPFINFMFAIAIVAMFFESVWNKIKRIKIK